MSGAYLAQPVGNGRWAVFRDGRKISGEQGRDIIEEQVARLARQAGERVRPCITCQRPFRSEGPHNRMCDRCRRLGGAATTDMSVVGDVAGRFR